MTETKNYLNSILGYMTEKEKLQKIIDRLNKFKTDKNNKNIYRSIVFCGPKGNGKHLFANVLANETGYNLYTLSINDDSVEEQITDTFETANECNPSIVVIDGIESLVDNNYLNNKNFKVLFTLIKYISTKKSSNVITILMTSNLDLLPKDFIKNIKVEYIIKFNTPSLKSRSEIISNYISQTSFNFKSSISFMTKNTKDLSVEQILVLLNSCIAFSSNDNVISNDVFVEQLNNIRTCNYQIDCNNKKFYYKAIQEIGKLIVARHFKKGTYRVNLDKKDSLTGNIFNDEILQEFDHYDADDDDYYLERSHTDLFSRSDFEKTIMTNLGKEIASDLILHDNYSNLYHEDLYSKIKYAVINGFYGIKYANDYSYDYNTIRGKKTEDKIDQVITDLYDKTESIIKQYLSLIITIASLLTRKRILDDKEIEPIIIDWLKNN